MTISLVSFRNLSRGGTQAYFTTLYGKNDICAKRDSFRERCMSLHKITTVFPVSLLMESCGKVPFCDKKRTGSQGTLKSYGAVYNGKNRMHALVRVRQCPGCGLMIAPCNQNSRSPSTVSPLVIPPVTTPLIRLDFSVCAAAVRRARDLFPKEYLPTKLDRPLKPLTLDQGIHTQAYTRAQAHHTTSYPTSLHTLLVDTCALSKFALLLDHRTTPAVCRPIFNGRLQSPKCKSLTYRSPSACKLRCALNLADVFLA